MDLATGGLLDQPDWLGQILDHLLRAILAELRRDRRQIWRPGAVVGRVGIMDRLSHDDSFRHGVLLLIQTQERVHGFKERGDGGAQAANENHQKNTGDDVTKFIESQEVGMGRRDDTASDKSFCSLFTAGANLFNPIQKVFAKRYLSQRGINSVAGWNVLMYAESSLDESEL